MSQMSLFSGEELKKAGIARVAENNREYVDEARRIALRVLASRGVVCSDDIHDLYPPPPWAHHNVVGAVFSGIKLKTLRYIRSRRPSAHGRMIRLYGLEDTS